MAARSTLIALLVVPVVAAPACDPSDDSSLAQDDPRMELAACGLPSPCEDAVIDGATADTGPTRCVLDVLSGTGPARLFASIQTIFGDATDYRAIEIFRWSDDSVTCIGIDAFGDAVVFDCTIDLPDECRDIPAATPVPEACLPWEAWGIESNGEVEPVCH